MKQRETSFGGMYCYDNIVIRNVFLYGNSQQKKNLLLLSRVEVKTEGTTVNEAEIIMWKSASWVWIVTSSLHHPNSFSAEIIIIWFYCSN